MSDRIELPGGPDAPASAQGQQGAAVNAVPLNNPDPVIEGETVAIPRSAATSKKKLNAPVIAIVIALGLMGLFIMLVKRPKPKVAPNATLHTPQKQAVQTVESPAQGGANSLPTDQQTVPDQQVNQQNTTPADVEKTRTDKTDRSPADTASQGNAFNQSLGNQPGFTTPQFDANGNQVWIPPAYGSGSAGNNNYIPAAGRSHANENAVRLAQVTKSSLTFIRPRTSQTGGSASSSSPAQPGESEITNFGYEPGFHIAARTEMVATTATDIPVIALVEYDYRRDGILVIPAGSRVTGTMTAASSTGIVCIRFNTIRLPNGSTVPISAIGLDQRMQPVKGVVTGRNRTKEFLVAAASGIGQSLAVFAGNNTNSSYSEADMIRTQAANNVGSQADNQINQLMVNEHIVVSVPAGTEMEVTFVSPSAPTKAAPASTTPALTAAQVVP